MKWILKPARFFCGILLSLFLFIRRHLASPRPASRLTHFCRLVGLAIDSADRNHVTDDLGSQVIRIDDISGKNAVALGSPGSGAGQFVMPTGIAIDAQDRIYLFDQLNNRLVRMDDMTGAGWTTLALAGNLSVAQSWSIAVDKQGRVYISDLAGSRILRIGDMSGANAELAGSQGSGAGQLAQPGSICISDRYGMLVVDTGNNRIARYRDWR